MVEIRIRIDFPIRMYGKMVFDSGDMKQGDTAKYIDLNVVGKKELKLVVTEGSDDQTDYDHANWVDTCFTAPPQSR